MRVLKSYPFRELPAVLLTGLSAFMVYSCMYAFRKPFTAASFSDLSVLGIDYKICAVIAQTIGYTISKFAGIRLIAGQNTDKRAVNIILFITLSWISLLFFALTPAPYNIVFLLLNGIPLGMVYGFVFSYIEGRRSTELLGAILAASFIFASGFAQSAGRFVMLQWNISKWWMPWCTGLLFMGPLILSTWLLSKTPPPTQADKLSRTERTSMNGRTRREFVKNFLAGIILLVTAYVLLTIIRDYRSSFAADMWQELGHGNDVSIFTRTELPASVIVLVIMGGLMLVRSNIKALIINHLLVISGFVVVLTATLLFLSGLLSSFWFMTATGAGLYLGYVPFNCMLFERIIAGFKQAGNAGFIIYIADSFGYLGSDAILVMKNFMKTDLTWTNFFIRIVFVSSVAGIVLVAGSAVYFSRKYKHFYSEKVSKNLYG